MNNILPIELGKGIAFYRDPISGVNHRVDYHGDDLTVCNADGCGHRWFSTHQALTTKEDILFALKAYTSKYSNLDFDESLVQFSL